MPEPNYPRLARRPRVDQLRTLIWIEEPSFRGCGCSECAWVFNPEGPPAGNSLAEMKQPTSCSATKNLPPMFALSTLEPRRQKANSFALQASTGHQNKTPFCPPQEIFEQLSDWGCHRDAFFSSSAQARLDCVSPTWR
jgi:hypothetical protein